MKKFVFGLLALSSVLLFQNCEPDMPYDGAPVPPEDSAYTGTFIDIEVPQSFPKFDLPADNPTSLEGIELGKNLFYDVNLSSTGELSCGSCHNQDFAFTDNGNQFSENVAGPTLRNSMPTFNLVWMKQLFWDGRANSIEAAIVDAITNEQHVDWNISLDYIKSNSKYARLSRKAFGDDEVTQDRMIQAIAQFLRTVNSPATTKFDQFFAQGSRNVPAVFTEDELMGFLIFSRDTVYREDSAAMYGIPLVPQPKKVVAIGGDCFHCHFTSPLFTDNLFHNNGLDEATSKDDFADAGFGDVTGRNLDYGKFKTPSLRNIALTGPYMHDGRFATLMEVIDHYSEGLKQSYTVSPLLKGLYDGGGRNLTDQEKDQLHSFLLTLTEDDLINDPAYSDPF